MGTGLLLIVNCHQTGWCSRAAPFPSKALSPAFEGRISGRPTQASIAPENIQL